MKLKRDAKEAIAKLKQLGIKKTVMLTGDRKSVAEQVANELGIDGSYILICCLLTKWNKWNVYLQRNPRRASWCLWGTALTMPLFLQELILVLQWVHLVPMLQIEAADIVIMNDKPSRIATVMGISGKH